MVERNIDIIVILDTSRSTLPVVEKHQQIDDICDAVVYFLQIVILGIVLRNGHV